MSRAVACLAFLGWAAAASPQEEPRAVQDIRSELARLPQYTVFDLISFDYEKGMVTLGGYVTEAGLRQAAGKTVERIEGVEKVTNRIEVLPNVIPDQKLRTELYRAIYRDSPLSRYGTGDDQLAASRARSTDGSRSASDGSRSPSTERPFYGMEAHRPGRDPHHREAGRRHPGRSGRPARGQAPGRAQGQERLGVRTVVKRLEVPGAPD
jgi:hypothetical protein